MINYRGFYTQGRFWTPSWDRRPRQSETIEAVQLADGSWHEFGTFVSQAVANAVYQDSIRAGLGLPPLSPYSSLRSERRRA